MRNLCEKKRKDKTRKIYVIRRTKKNMLTQRFLLFLEGKQILAPLLLQYVLQPSKLIDVK